MKKNIKTLLIRAGNLCLQLSLIFFIVSTACNHVYQYQSKSEIIEDKSAGMNGGFEFVKDGLPVNWLFYTPKTVPDSDFDLIIDTINFCEGRQSLKYVIRQCRSDGGWYSPGFCKEFPANKEESYRISFLIRNSDTRFYAKIGGIGSVSGQYETIVNSNEQITDWKKFEYIFSIPQKMDRVRFELNVLKPGTFWIDDIKLENI